ncbi:TetR/AcrR family transcriptional regulator [Streptomyces celluloflavus]|uniref:TetR/AcrR family transcriptional regulator n=1 Tax=Streptomyces celluloflavus TaxID=58344 RepID=UPI0036B204AD
MPDKTAQDPVKRRARPGKAPLSRELILTTAQRLLDRDGLPGVSLRKIAAELDTGPASIYVYVSNMQELHSLLLDRALSEVDLSGDGTGDARERLQAILHSYLRTLLDRPGLAKLAGAMPHGPNALRLTEALLDALLDSGVAPPSAAWGVDLLLLHVAALAAELSYRREGGRELNEVADVYARAPAEDFPRIRQVSTHLFSGDGPTRFRWQLDALIQGIGQVCRPLN